jgi:hypothetical protein
LERLDKLVASLGSQKDLNTSQSAFLGKAYFSLGQMQQIRKSLITLYKLKIPPIQWYVLDFLALVVIGTIGLLPVEHVQGLIVKTSFSVVIVAVLILIRRLNNLNLFENIVGRSTAEDVLDIINKKA